MNQRIQPYIGRRIRDVRKRQRITQRELAAWLQALRAPITRDIIANWETGRGDVPAYCIQIIAYSLGARVADILPDLTLKEMIVGRLKSNAAIEIRKRRKRISPVDARLGAVDHSIDD